MTEVIKQTDKVSCVACVAAMATGTSVHEFRTYFGEKTPPFSDLDFYRYLLSRGYVVGIGYYHEETRTFVNKDTGLKIHFRIKDYPAYVVVKSMRFPGMEHVIYWDGEKVFDSNPEIEGDGLPVNEYAIISWFPIIKCDGFGGITPTDTRDFDINT